MWGPGQSLGVVIGFVIIAVGLVAAPKSMISRASMNLSLVLLSVFVVIALGEGFFRLINYDFRGEEQAWLKTPIYYRQPIAPTGDVFFKRTGPDEWTGQVLNTRIKQRGVVPNPYTAEPVITVRYDRRGFRNPDNLSDWSVAVAGDSFTELGYLPYEQLFTSILARIGNVSVLNLGTSFTGPLTHLSYLQDFGIAASTRHAMIVFYEGNDLDDLAREYSALARWRKTGQRDYREFTKQPSLLKALHELLGHANRKLRGRQRRKSAFELVAERPVTGYFKSSEGSVPVTLFFTPLGSAQLSNATTQHLNYFFGQYANFGKEREITVWLAFMPSKLRVVHGRIEFSATASDELKTWQPTDLPEVISQLCDQYGINFIDLTPTLVRETDRTKQLLYNSILDGHLNSHGSLIVGRELARYFSRRN
jgi:hypothetical protein